MQSGWGRGARQRRQYLKEVLLRLTSISLSHQIAAFASTITYQENPALAAWLFSSHWRC